VTLPATLDVALPDGRIVTARVRPSARARMPRVRVGAQVPLHLVIPHGATAQQASSALDQKARWIADKLDAIERLRCEAVPLGLDRPGVVWLAGEAITVRQVEAGRGPRMRGGALEVTAGEPNALRETIGRWYRRQARASLRPVVAEEAERLGIQPGRLVVRDQRTRWGSCSSAGTLSFSWRLVIAPPEVLRYVAIHELLHLRIANHSKGFWRSLGTAMPDWEVRAAWLRRHGDELRGYQPRLDASLGWGGNRGREAARLVVVPPGKTRKNCPRHADLE
jgi:predicted metal-dependent hydrolase